MSRALRFSLNRWTPSAEDAHDDYLRGYHTQDEKEIVLEFSNDRRGEILYDFFPVHRTRIA
jgi:hypothetical protein